MSGRTPSGDVGAKDPKMARQGFCQRVEIPPVAGQAVHAQHDAVIIVVAPFVVVNPVKSGWAEAEKTVLSHSG